MPCPTLLFSFQLPSFRPKWAWIRVLMTLLLLAFIAWSLRDEFFTFQQKAEYGYLMQPVFWVLACTLLPINLGIEALKWRIAVHNHYPELTFFQSFAAICRGSALGLITPNRLGDYAGRVFSLDPGHRIEAAVGTLIGRLSQLCATLLFGIMGLLFLAIEQSIPPVILFYLLPSLILLITSLSIFFHNPILFQKLGFFVLDKLKFRRESTWFDALYKVLDAILHVSTSVTRRLVLLSFLRWCVFSLQYVLLLWAFGAEKSGALMASLVAVVLRMKSFVPSIALAEIGIREFIALGVMGWAGLDEPVIFLSTFSLYVINILLPGISGALLIYRLKLPFPNSQ